MAVLCLDPLQQFFDNDGNPLAGGFVESFTPDGTTPLATYTDTNGLVAHENPIPLDAAGRPEDGPIFYTQGAAYNLVLKTASGVILDTNISFDVPEIAAAENNTFVDVVWFRPGGSTTASEIIYAERFARAVDFLANWSGAYALTTATVMTAPAASYVVTVKKNGSTVGTITFNTDGTVTFATSGGAAVSFAAGDIISFHGQVTPDANLANFGVVLPGSLA
jgi:hypothetical protein